MVHTAPATRTRRGARRGNRRAVRVAGGLNVLEVFLVGQSVVLEDDLSGRLLSEIAAGKWRMRRLAPRGTL
jgi:hypothetical protein